MARLIVVDASCVIATLARDDAHHQAASAAWSDASPDDEFVLAATTRTEVLVGPTRAGGVILVNALGFVNGCHTLPVTEALADRAAYLRARHRALSVPDAITLAAGDQIDADEIWTFDRHWGTVSQRVVVPGS